MTSERAEAGIGHEERWIRYELQNATEMTALLVAMIGWFTYVGGLHLDLLAVLGAGLAIAFVKAGKYRVVPDGERLHVEHRKRDRDE
jgi:hypothetical protein